MTPRAAIAQVEWKSIIYCSIGGFAGVIVGLENLELTPPYAKMYFVVIWGSFAGSLYYLNRLQGRKVGGGGVSTPLRGAARALLSALARRRRHTAAPRPPRAPWGLIRRGGHAKRDAYASGGACLAARLASSRSRADAVVRRSPPRAGPAAASHLVSPHSLRSIDRRVEGVPRRRPAAPAEDLACGRPRRRSAVPAARLRPQLEGASSRAAARSRSTMRVLNSRRLAPRGGVLPLQRSAGARSRRCRRRPPAGVRDTQSSTRCRAALLAPLRHLSKPEALTLLVAGFIGGVFTAMSGSGIDICSFAVLTLLFRLTEKTATPTSVVLMAVNTFVAMCYRAFWMDGGLQPDAWGFFVVCAPIVVVGAPLGSVRARAVTADAAANVEEATRDARACGCDSVRSTSEELVVGSVADALAVGVCRASRVGVDAASALMRVHCRSHCAVSSSSSGARLVPPPARARGVRLHHRRRAARGRALRRAAVDAREVQ